MAGRGVDIASAGVGVEDKWQVLAAAVINRAKWDLCGKRAMAAREFLGSRDGEFWCDCAGFAPEGVRKLAGLN